MGFLESDSPQPDPALEEQEREMKKQQDRIEKQQEAERIAFAKAGWSGLAFTPRSRPKDTLG